jgi:sigma-B regulation protein RsbU (phosphoserine phosphatase)
MSNQNEKYFTIWYGVYNQVTRQLVYASAGHPPAILISGTSTFTPEIKKLKTPGLPIGMFPESKFIDANCDIEKDSILYVFSDGIYEINQSEGNLWGLDAFIHLLSHPGEQNIFDLDDLLNYVLSLSTADALEDDLSLLEIKFG